MGIFDFFCPVEGIMAFHSFLFFACVLPAELVFTNLCARLSAGIRAVPLNQHPQDTSKLHEARSCVAQSHVFGYFSISKYFVVLRQVLFNTAEEIRMCGHSK